MPSDDELSRQAAAEDRKKGEEMYRFWSNEHRMGQWDPMGQEENKAAESAEESEESAEEREESAKRRQMEEAAAAAAAAAAEEERKEERSLRERKFLRRLRQWKGLIQGKLKRKSMK